MSDLIKFGNDSLLPNTSDRQTRKAIEAVDRQAAVIEAAAQRKFAMATSLNQTAKLHVATSVSYSRQLAEFVPEAEALFRALDLQTAEVLRSTLERATR